MGEKYARPEFHSAQGPRKLRRPALSRAAGPQAGVAGACPAWRPSDTQAQAGQGALWLVSYMRGWGRDRPSHKAADTPRRQRRICSVSVLIGLLRSSGCVHEAAGGTSPMHPPALHGLQERDWWVVQARPGHRLTEPRAGRTEGNPLRPPASVRVSRAGLTDRPRASRSGAPTSQREAIPLL